MWTAFNRRLVPITPRAGREMVLLVVCVATDSVDIGNAEILGFAASRRSRPRCRITRNNTSRAAAAGTRAVVPLYLNGFGHGRRYLDTKESAKAIHTGCGFLSPLWWFFDASISCPI